MRAYAVGWLVMGLFYGTTSGAHPLGLFAAECDVGSVSQPGSSRLDAGQDRYVLTAAGANTWYRMDAFHYVWTKHSGDAALGAQVSFPPHTYAHEPDPHRKGLLMFRQNLDASAPYVDVAVHGSGLVALQYRREFGANTEDIELNIPLPKAVRLEKRGDQFTLLISEQGEPMHAVGATVHLHLSEPFLAGIGALSHDARTVDSVEFSKVVLESPQHASAAGTMRESSLVNVQIEDQYRRAIVIRSGSTPMQSPNWAPGGRDIYVHESGRLVDIPVLDPQIGGTPRPVDVGPLLDCSGNFGVAPDGQTIAVSCADAARGNHQVYVVPLHGGAPKRLTNGPESGYFHAWSPDGTSLAFTRGKASRADIYAVSVEGGAEKRLTTDTLNDGPDYTADGKYIYFDSARSGRLQIWRMNADGSEPTQVTGDLSANSSPHVSPDGKSVAFLSQASDSGDAIARTTLKILTPADGMIRAVTEFDGNRGSLAMNSWLDHNHLALIEYSTLPTEFVRPKSP
jgi:Tol biopolymer transport system component